METSIVSQVEAIAKQSRTASFTLATLPTERKNGALETLAQLIEQRTAFILEANQKDIQAGEAAQLNEAMLDRLRFTPERLQALAENVCAVIALPDPVGELIETIKRPNGLNIEKIRTPIGVVGIIYESRPNVTIDCAILCLKSGNAAILRGGKEAFHSNRALAGLVKEALKKNEIPETAVQFIPTIDRVALEVLLQQDDYVDCIIPRGGEGLIRFVAENALMPVIKHYKGVCNIYIDCSAEMDLAQQLILNAKCQRPGVCNAIENLFIHETIAPTFLPRIAKVLVDHKVELRVDRLSADMLKKADAKVPFKMATEQDYYEEYIDLILAIKIVPSLDEAIQTINTYGSRHSDAIVATDADVAKRFMSAVDTATVYWNASTRFTDGFEFGLGAEIGISTDKLHARGPMGLRELCSYKYLIFGNGQVR